MQYSGQKDSGFSVSCRGLIRLPILITLPPASLSKTIYDADKAGAGLLGKDIPIQLHCLCFDTSNEGSTMEH